MALEDLNIAKTIIVVAVLAGVYLLEHLYPFFHDRKDRREHALKNLGLGLINAVVIALFFASLTAGVATYMAQEGRGLFYEHNIPAVVMLVVAILVMDFWMYIWHVLNHKIPFLWRFHLMHHTDTHVDSTSALRFHTGEIILSSLARLPIIAALGMSMSHVVIYEMILLPVIIFHHSNVNIPEKWDKLYRSVFASPHMHRIHHSEIPDEYNSNYTSIFSWWDRLCGTYQERPDAAKGIVQGVQGFRNSRWTSFKGMFKTPFERLK